MTIARKTDLLILANQQKWDFGLDWLRLPETQVLSLVWNYADALLAVSRKLDREFVLKWGDSSSECLSISPELAESLLGELSIMSMDEITVVSDRLFVNPQLLQVMDSSLLRVAEKLIELGQDGTPAGLVVSNSPTTPNYQAWVNQCSEQLFKAKGLELVKVDTTRYWHPEDLEALYQTLKDHSSQQSFTFTYRAQANHNNPDQWLRLTSEITVVEAIEQRYRLSKTIDSESIPRPQNLKVD